MFLINNSHNYMLKRLIDYIKIGERMFVFKVLLFTCVMFGSVFAQDQYNEDEEVASIGSFIRDVGGDLKDIGGDFVDFGGALYDAGGNVVDAGVYVVRKGADGLEKAYRVGEDGVETFIDVGDDVLTEIKISLGLEEKHACGVWTKKDGSSASKFDRFFTDWLIPDYFPIDEAATKATLLIVNPLLGATLIAMESCTLLGLGHAKLYPSCEEHDRCSEQYLEDGEVCDDNLLSDWKGDCRAQYGKYSVCRAACIEVVEVMHETLLAIHPLTHDKYVPNIVPTIITPLLLN